MNIPVKKLNNGFEIPAIGFGTWTIGGRSEPDYSRDTQDIQAIQNALAEGLMHLDTAEGYAAGHAEELIAHAIRGYDRTKLFLKSKVSEDHLHYDDVLASCDASLKRLRTDYLDLYLIHWPNNSIPIEETLRALDRLKGEGAIRNIGVSNFATRRLKEAQQRTANPIVVNQVLYNLIYRLPEKDGLVDYCQHNDVILEAYRPVERGLLVDADPKIIGQLAIKYGKTASQIAISWLVSQKNVVTIFKTNDSGHLRENMGGVGWEMEKEDIELLRTNYPNQNGEPDDSLT